MNLWHDQRLRLSITRLGAQFLGALLLMGAFAVNTGNNLLYLIFSLMLGLFLASGWASRQAIRDLAFLDLEAGNVFARVRGGLRARFRDGAPGRARGLEIHVHLDGGQMEPGFYGGAVGAREPVVLLHARPTRRGAARLLRLELRTTFPFGLMEKAWTFPLNQDLLVLPHPRSLAPRAGLEGDLRAPRFRAGTSSPDGARPFREQDPLSRVHWKRTAQRGTPWVRTFEDEQPSGLRLHLDPRQWGPGPAFERELEILSGSILQARLQRRNVFLAIAGAEGARAFEGYTASWRALAVVEALGPVQGAGSALT